MASNRIRLRLSGMRKTGCPEGQTGRRAKKKSAMGPDAGHTARRVAGKTYTLVYHIPRRKSRQIGTRNQRGRGGRESHSAIRAAVAGEGDAAPW